MHYQLCCIGQLTLDKVVTPQSTVFMPGGTAYYFSLALAGFPLRYLLVTAVAESEADVVTKLRQRGVNVTQLPTAQTLFFENRYGDNPNERRQRVLAQADPFLLKDLQSLQASVFHFGPLLAHDIPHEAMAALAAKGKVSLDVQGLLRKVEGEAVVPVDWPAKKEVLPFVHFLKASEEEAFTLTGCRDVCEGAKRLHGWGAKEVIITLGSKGSVVYNGNAFFYIPAYEPTAVVDATGCGDTYTAGYLYQRESGADIQEAGEFAAAMATLNIAVSGPFTGTEDDVRKVLTNNRRTKESLTKTAAVCFQNDSK